MPNPFPGMNPWLENPALWRDVHHRLISGLADELAPRLRPRYFVAVETHTYISVASTQPPATRYPDVMVNDRGGPAVAVAPAAESFPFLTVELPIDDPVEEGYLEVRLVPTGEVITIIELLSHANKQPGRDREAYVQKREDLLVSQLNFVEIDLLRAGPVMPHAERAKDSAYRLFIRRRERARKARLYPFSVRQPIPAFPLPLLPDDSEPTVDLGAVLNAVYDRAGYDLVIRYDQPPAPPLSADDSAWAESVLTMQASRQS
ncbi:MAG: DUF4058 family protein [Chloroflexi bacterium]|nr:DUF4058 family protein [Chloroflexota bacterium]